MTDLVVALAVSLAGVLVIYGAMMIGRAMVELVMIGFNRWLTRDLRKRQHGRRED